MRSVQIILRMQKIKKEKEKMKKKEAIPSPDHHPGYTL